MLVDGAWQGAKQKGISLAKDPRLSLVGNSLPQGSQTTSRLMVMTTAREGARENALVKCEASHFGQATAQLSQTTSLSVLFPTPREWGRENTLD